MSDDVRTKRVKQTFTANTCDGGMVRPVPCILTWAVTTQDWRQFDYGCLRTGTKETGRILEEMELRYPGVGPFYWRRGQSLSALRDSLMKHFSYVWDRLQPIIDADPDSYKVTVTDDRQGGDS